MNAVGEVTAETAAVLTGAGGALSGGDVSIAAPGLSLQPAGPAPGPDPASGKGRGRGGAGRRAVQAIPRV